MSVCVLFILKISQTVTHIKFIHYHALYTKILNLRFFFLHEFFRNIFFFFLQKKFVLNSRFSLISQTTASIIFYSLRSRAERFGQMTASGEISPRPFHNVSDSRLIKAKTLTRKTNKVILSALGFFNQRLKNNFFFSVQRFLLFFFKAVKNKL